MTRPSPTPILPPHLATYERHVVRGQHPDECYGWAGPLTQDGYPRVRAYGTRETVAARVAWWAERPGEALPEAVVPVCGCRVCTNPRHLRPSRRRGQPPAFFGRVSYARRP